MKLSYSKFEANQWSIPNYWDVVALIIVLAAILLLGWSAKQMAGPFQLGQTLPIHLEPRYLPLYAVRTVMRMFVGLFFALTFTFIFGTWAGKSRAAERMIIPAIDILQSVPVLSFLSITITGFIALFKGSMLGPECAAIFAIFAAQTWNMTLSFYQNIRSVPKELKEAAHVFQLSPWQQFWRVDVPFTMPGLLWNIMMSMSGSWFFVTASEAITVADQKITLPGMGSYIALAIKNADKMAILFAILTMLIVIFLYDQLLFRPLSAWVEKFKFEKVEDINTNSSWVITLFQRTKLLSKICFLCGNAADLIVNLPLFRKKIGKSTYATAIRQRYLSKIYLGLLLAAIVYIVFLVVRFLIENVTFDTLRHLALLGFFTGTRVMSLIVLSSLIWVPVGVWIGSKPRIAAAIQPIVQFLAAFPANLLFPVIAILIVNWKLNVEVWTSPLMVLGTQWYILFNVIAGTLAIPKDLKQASATFGVRGFLKWRTLILPGIFPYYVTGAITAAGGAWNASIIAEVINWGKIHIEATGLGAFITNASDAGNFLDVALGTIIMCLFVLVINRLIWRPLYNLAIEKFTLG